GRWRTGPAGSDIDPAQDRRPGSADERPVGEVSLPTFVRQVRLRPPRPGIQGERLRRDDHPSVEEQILTGKESAELRAVPTPLVSSAFSWRPGWLLPRRFPRDPYCAPAPRNR